jgi:hypothetical protein
VLTINMILFKMLTLYRNVVTAAMEEESSDLPGTDGLAPKQRHQAKHRELFLSRHVETLPATHIRGKCTVTLLNETESLLSYLNKDVSMYSDTKRAICANRLLHFSKGVDSLEIKL